MDDLATPEPSRGLLSEEYELQQRENADFLPTASFPSINSRSRSHGRRSQHTLIALLSSIWRISSWLLSRFSEVILNPSIFRGKIKYAAGGDHRFDTINNASKRNPYPWALRRTLKLARIFLVLVLVFLAFVASVFPSYTRPPRKYIELAQLVSKTGRGNVNAEKVFIAATINDQNGELAGGDWGHNLLSLVEILGAENCFVSIYANGGSGGQDAVKALRKSLDCDNNVIFEEHIELSQLPKIVLPGGSERIKRIDMLAKVRNQALQPLIDLSTRFHKVLYINDVVFRPIDATNLLFSTHADTDGRTRYRAACAVDFINPFKFYDTYASRDLEGYSMGIPFYPWFSNAGGAESRHDVLQQTDAVRVRSCWGGMVAFDAKVFQPSDLTDPMGLATTFRATDEMFWDASECCLIHADIQDVPTLESPDSGIYMNPYIRVAYDSRTLSWLAFTRRFERSYSLIHNILNHLAGLPRFNPRRTEVAGELVQDKVWVTSQSESGGSFQTIQRPADAGGFCGRRELSVLRTDRKKGQKYWENVPVPSDG